MRNIYILLLLIPLLGKAQFKATSNGFIAEDGNNFMVFEINGKSANDIYNSVEAWAISSFKNPDNVVSKQENKMLNIHGIYENAFTHKLLLEVAKINVDMNFVISFKDGKIKFDAPIINKMFYRFPVYDTILKKNTYKEELFVFSKKYYQHYYNHADMNGLQPRFLFKKDGEPRNTYVTYIANMNDFVNSIIYEIINYAKCQTDNNW